MVSPRTSVDPATPEQQVERDGLSLGTLIIAAIASGAAAVIVSQFWARGTVIASALTPVVVAILSEMLRKPVESDRMRSVASGVRSGVRPRSGRTPSVLAPPPAGVDDGLRRREEGVEAGPVRVYSSGSNRRPRAPAAPGAPRRRLHLKIAVITGLIAFVIAAAVLTLPELIFGGSVSGGSGGTTYFGGGSDSGSDSETQDGGSGDGQTDEPSQQDGGSGGSSGGDEEAAPSGGGESEPDSGGSGGSEPPPSEPAPSEPAPQTPAPPSVP